MMSVWIRTVNYCGHEHVTWYLYHGDTFLYFVPPGGRFEVTISLYFLCFMRSGNITTYYYIYYRRTQLFIAVINKAARSGPSSYAYKYIPKTQVICNKNIINLRAYKFYNLVFNFV